MLVAFLIAREVLSIEKPTKGFCIGSGYTILRAAEQTIANPSKHFGTTWIPMMSHTYRDLIKSTTFYTANFVVRLLANFYLGSSALYLPHRRYTSETTEVDIQTVFKTALQDATVALTSTNGIGRRSNQQEYPELNYTAPDGRRYYDMTDMYETLQNEVGEKYIFEFLGNFYDEDMNEVGSEDLRAKLRERVLSVPLETIDAIRKRGKVYVVGARKYKARPILTLLRHKIANCLVIDKEIAEWLLANS